MAIKNIARTREQRLHYLYCSACEVLEAWESDKELNELLQEVWECAFRMAKKKDQLESFSDFMNRGSRYHQDLIAEAQKTRAQFIEDSNGSA